MNDEVFLIRTGIANTASLISAFSRLDASCRFVRNGDDVLTARYLVLPGVGAFAAGMESLLEQHLTGPLKERIESNKPTLAICLGMQLLASSSEESPGIAGLGILPGRAVKFRPPLRVPHFGWNMVCPASTAKYRKHGYAYFANSYFLQDAPEEWNVSLTSYSPTGPCNMAETTFISAIEKGRILACQFHPELSGRFGSDLISSWLRG